MLDLLIGQQRFRIVFRWRPQQPFTALIRLWNDLPAVSCRARRSARIGGVRHVHNCQGHIAPVVLATTGGIETAWHVASGLAERISGRRVEHKLQRHDAPRALRR